MAGEDANTGIINLDIVADGVQAGIEQAIASLGGLGDAGTTSTAKIFEGAFLAEAAMKALEAAVELAKQGFELLAEGVKLAAEKEQDISQLNLSMASMGQYTNGASQAMIEYAEQLQKTSTFSSDAVLKAEALATKFTTSAEETEKLTKAAVNLSAVTGTDLNTAIQSLGLSLDGQVGRLNKMVPGVNALTASQLQLGGALDIVNQRYGGAAADTVNTFNGRLTVMKNSFDNLLESFGKMITDSPIVNASIEAISKAFQAGAKWVTQFANAGNFDAFLKSLIDIGQGFVKYVVAPLELAYNVVRTFIDVLHLGLQAIFESVVQVGNAIVQVLVGGMTKAVDGIAFLVGKFSKTIGDSMKDAAQSVRTNFLDPIDSFAVATTETTRALSTEVNNNASKMFDFPLSAQLSGHLSTLDTFFKQAEKKTTDFSAITGATVKKVSLDLGKMLQDGLAKTVSTSLSMVGASLVQGGNAFSNFGGVIFGILGDLATKMGENMIAQGVAILGLKTAIETMQPEVAFAAGAALLVLGGALKAMAGGSAGSSSSPSLSSGGSAGASPVAASATPSSPSTSQQQQTSAQIIINGDFLNSQQTANHLADILRQNSDTTNYAIVAQGKQY